MTEEPDYGPPTPCRASFSHVPKEPTELPLAADEALECWPDESGWWYARKRDGSEGYVPRTFIVLDGTAAEDDDAADADDDFDFKLKMAMALSLSESSAAAPAPAPPPPSAPEPPPRLPARPASASFAALQRPAPAPRPRPLSVDSALFAESPEPIDAASLASPRRASGGPRLSTPRAALKSARRSLRGLVGGKKRSPSAADAAPPPPADARRDAEIEALRARNEALEAARRSSEAERARLARELDVRRAAPPPAAAAAPPRPPPPEDLDPGDECAVCMERAKDTALVPCGHVLCGVCVSKANDSRIVDECPVCRVAVRSTMRIFL